MVTQGQIMAVSYTEDRHRITLRRTHWLYRGVLDMPIPKELTIDGVIDGEVGETLFTDDGPPIAYFYSGAGAVYLEGGRRLMSNAKETNR